MKRSNKGFVILLICSLMVASCTLSPEEPLSVRYRLTGSVASAEVEYLNAGGDMIDEGEVDIPWEIVVQICEGSYAEIQGTKVTCSGMLRAYISCDGDSWYDFTEASMGVVSVRVKIED